jgi:hypothetical protein
MRITEDTADRLTLTDSALWLAAFLAAGAAVIVYASVAFANLKGFLPAALFFGGAVWFTRTTMLIVDKRQRSCVLRRWTPWAVSRTTFAFEQITDVRIETFMAGRRNQVPTFRLALVTSAGDLPLTASFESGRAQYDAMRNTCLAAIRT